MIPGFPRYFTLDRISFWIGFLAGVLFLWMLGLSRPVFRQLWNAGRARVRALRAALTASTESRLRQDVIRRAQRMHLAATLFSLDEILVEPRVLAPPPPFEPGGKPPPGDVFSLTLPDLPDWPELASSLHGRALPLAQALSRGASLILVGRPGLGKTVALAHLASQVARRDPVAGELGERLPLLLHVLELPGSEPAESDPLAPLIQSVAAYAGPLAQSRLPELLRRVFSEGRALLLLDGLNEMPPPAVDGAVAYLRRLLEQYPGTQAVVAAGSDYYADLATAGLIPLALASWEVEERQQFVQKWSENWLRFIAPSDPAGAEDVHPLILNGWLLGMYAAGAPALSPLEFTLKVWEAWAGDGRGLATKDALEAYLLRLTAGLPSARPFLENLALQLVLDQNACAGHKQTQAAAIDSNRQPFSPAWPEPVASGWVGPAGRKEPEKVDLPGVWPALIENGLLVERRKDCLSFGHPSLAGYLAARALIERGGGADALAGQPEWSGKVETLYFLAALGGMDGLVNASLETASDPLLRQPLQAARWLVAAPKSAPWRPALLRLLAEVIQREDLALGLRSRALVALANSGENGVTGLFRQLLASGGPQARGLAALGCGLCRDASSVEDLGRLLAEATPFAGRAALLALAAIGTGPALEMVASVLLHGDEELRRAAAEVLAAHPSEGHALLREASAMDDLLVRRAVVSGLAFLREKWAVELLEKMAIEDGQWVVRTAAQEALERLAHPDPHIPVQPPALTDTPWLIAFAGERGIGVLPGKPAVNLLLEALHAGSDDQRLAALDALRQHSLPAALPDVYRCLSTDDLELREAALRALWYMRAAGVDLSGELSRIV